MRGVRKLLNGNNKVCAKMYYLPQARLQLRNAYKQLLFKAIIHIKLKNYQIIEKLQ